MPGSERLLTLPQANSAVLEGLLNEPVLGSALSAALDVCVWGDRLMGEWLLYSLLTVQGWGSWLCGEAPLTGEDNEGNWRGRDPASHRGPGQQLMTRSELFPWEHSAYARSALFTHQWALIGMVQASCYCCKCCKSVIKEKKTAAILYHWMTRNVCVCMCVYLLLIKTHI